MKSKQVLFHCYIRLIWVYSRAIKTCWEQNYKPPGNSAGQVVGVDPNSGTLEDLFSSQMKRRAVEVHDELDLYLSTPVAVGDNAANPLIWWKVNTITFLILRQILSLFKNNVISIGPAIIRVSEFT